MISTNRPWRPSWTGSTELSGGARRSKRGVYEDFRVLCYADLRWLKSGILLAIDDLKRHRDEQFSKYTSLPVRLVEAVNSKIAELENIAESSAFNGMKPIPLLVYSTRTAEPRVQVAAPDERSDSTPWVVMRVELLDAELRRRCGDLFEKFTTTPEDQDRFDTVLREASTLVEDRIRQASGLGANEIGLELISKAFATDNGALIISQDANEQNAAHSLFRGFFGFVRNTVQHNLVPTYTRERAAQVLGFADYLLFLLSRARARNLGAPVSSK